MCVCVSPYILDELESHFLEGNRCLSKLDTIITIWWTSDDFTINHSTVWWKCNYINRWLWQWYWWDVYKIEYREVISLIKLQYMVDRWQWQHQMSIWWTGDSGNIRCHYGGQVTVATSDGNMVDRWQCQQQMAIWWTGDSVNIRCQYGGQVTVSTSDGNMVDRWQCQQQMSIWWTGDSVNIRCQYGGQLTVCQMTVTWQKRK